MKQVKARVISNEQILPEFRRQRGRSILGSYLIWLDCPEIVAEARPGQFVMVRCGGESVLPRPFSIHQVNEKGHLALLYAVLEDGKGTGWLARSKAGDTVEMFGPMGNGYSIPPTARHLLLLAGGIGIAPLYFLAQEALKKGRPVTLVYGTANKYGIDRTEDEALFPPIPLPDGIEVIDITEDGSSGKKGRVTDLVLEFVDKADQIFACGPLPMYRDMALRKHELGLDLKPVQVSLEVRMGCGRGVCYGCTVKTKRGLKLACQDGPVFDLDDILWDEPIC